MIVHHNPASIYPPAGPYAHGVEVIAPARVLYISGTMGLAPDGVAADDFRTQCELAWTNIAAVLENAGMSVRNLVKVNCFLADPGDRAVNAEVRNRILGDHRVAVTVVAVALLESAWKLEVEAVAVA